MIAESDTARYTRPTATMENSATRMDDFLAIAVTRACQGGRTAEAVARPELSQLTRHFQIATTVDRSLFKSSYW